MSANFTPVFGGYRQPGAFKFWCQKVLPLVYDDSLSYYELLCKVVDYINNLIHDNSETIDNMDALLTAYNQLQDYVNNYFANLDLTGEVSNKIDEMVEDGDLLAIIQPTLDAMGQYLVDQSEAQQTYNEQTRSFVSTSIADQTAYNIETRNDVTNSLNTQTAYNERTREIAQAMVGHPFTANTSSDMADQTKVYVYTGTTSGNLVNGHWYYYNNGWVDGGVYNSQGLSTDKSLTLEDNAADARYTGLRIDALTTPLTWRDGIAVSTQTGEERSDNGHTSSAKFTLVNPLSLVGVDRIGFYTDGVISYGTGYLHLYELDSNVYIGFCYTLNGSFSYQSTNSSYPTLPDMPMSAIVDIIKSDWNTVYPDSWANVIRLIKGHDEVIKLRQDLNIINPTADITWELGKSINSSGEVITNTYIALSNEIQCEPGDLFVTTSPTVDANNKFLVYYIAQYNGDTFISRTEFTSSIRSLVIGNNTTKIRIAFGRYGSSQTPITPQDITTYVAIKFVRKAASKADTNLQFRNTVLNKYTDIGTGINDITENSFVFSPEGTPNNPTTTGGYFIQTILYNTAGTAAMQIAYKYDVGLCYYRRKVSGSWRSWILNSSPASPTSPLYYAFGDSLTYGSVWTPIDESPYYQITQASLINQIPTRIANAIGAANSFSNRGVGGSYFVGTGTNKIITAIQNQDLSNAKIITIAGGRNDSENTLGDKTSTSGDGTICGAIREILDYVTTNYKKLQIVWIGVTPNTSNNATVFTRVFAGGWSLNSFDEKVAELCAEYSVPYVNWKMCTYIRHWADYSGAAQVYSHPNNEESYLQMGNYIAGQVAQYYRG